MSHWWASRKIAAMSVPTRQTTASEPGDLSALVGFALVGVAILLALISLGVVLVAASKLVGLRLPTAHDDPHRVEIGGLALLAGYGVVATAAIAALRRLALHLPPLAQRALGRLIGTAILLLVAVGGVWIVVEDHDARGAGIALASGYAAVRVALGLPLPSGDEDGDWGREDLDRRR
jgi:hypothetical protein